MQSAALFNLGFRPFFLGASLFAAVSMSLWLAVYGAYLWLPLGDIAPSQWHAHEMIYGYAMAVIAGFLLTAIRNWTNLPTVSGIPLLLLFAAWLLARVLFCFGRPALIVAAGADLLFGILLCIHCALPIARARQWKQMAVLSKLVLLTGGNAIFYAGAFGHLEHGVYWGLYGGFYLVIALILTMGRRLIPFFLERGVQPPPVIRNSSVLDLSSLTLLLVFWFAEVFLGWRGVATLCSAALFVVNAARLGLWYSAELWRYPLLWSLYLSFACIAVGFLLRAVSDWLSLPPFIALHMLAVGGVGLITLSMMARVSLGHTGRSVHQPPRTVLVPLLLVVLTVLLRVALPLLAPRWYAQSVYLAQLAWIAAFGWFGIAWLPVLTQPRVDGLPG